MPEKKQIIKRPEVVYIKGKNYVVFTYDFLGLGYAYRLKQEGNRVVMGVLSPKEAGFEMKGEDDKEIDKRRLTIGDNMVKKYPAKMILEHLKGIEDKEDYFIDFDFNYGAEIAAKLVKMGYKGFFPTEKGRELETDRQAGQEMAKKVFEDLKLPEEKAFKTVEDALTFIEKKQDVYVVKANNPDVSCFVPLKGSDEFDQYLEEVRNYLEHERKDLESDGFILQKKIERPVEITPEQVYMEGQPVYQMCDLETKFYGNGEVGQQTGSTLDVNFVLDKECELCKMALEGYEEVAKKENTSNFMDASILFDKKGQGYFGEFCPERKGYNAFYTELAMLPSVSRYFESLAKGINPFLTEGAKRFGASIRIFNTAKDDKRFVKADLQIQAEGRYVWLMDAKKDEEGNLMTAGQNYDTAVVTGCGDTIDEAIEDCENNLKYFSMKDGYYRTDLKSEEWFSPKYRYRWLESKKLI